MKKTILITILAVLVVAFTAPRLDGDDKELFMGVNVSQNTVKPNVMILADTSGSMNNLIWYPKLGLDGEEGTADDGFNPRISYSGTVNSWTYYDASNYYQYEFTGSGTWYSSSQSTKWYGRWRDGTTARSYRWSDLDDSNNITHIYEVDGVNIRTGSNPNNWSVGDWVMYHNQNSTTQRYARAKIAAKYSDAAGNWLTLSDIEGGTIVGNSDWERVWVERVPGKVPIVVRLYSELDSGNSTRLDENYLKWIFLYASLEQVEAVSHHSLYGTFDVTDTSLLGATSVCDTGGGDAMKRFTRIQVTREVLCQVARNSNATVRMGLFTFDGGGNDYGNGGRKVENLGDKSDSADLESYLGHIWGIEGDSNTPVAEALADVWDYLKPHPPGDDDPDEFWPTDVLIDNGTISAATAESPIQWWCQNNYVVVMTDGESTQDNFANSKFSGSIFTSPGISPVKRSTNWASWADGWGDLDDNEAYYGRPSGYNSSTALYCPLWSCWLTSNGTDYLDDVAYFLRNQDLFPDDDFGTDTVNGWPGPQSIFTYVIGFNQDNDMLLETAVNGDGAYYTAGNFDELVASFESVITSILLRNFAFSAITAPKKTASIAADGVSYVGYFMPSQSAPVWEGHLLANELIERWGFDANGDGEYASDEMYASEAQCEGDNPGETCSRVINLSNTEMWDAASKLENRSTDRSLFTHSGSTRVDFTAANKATLAPMIGCTEAQVETIIAKVGGKTFGDIFHSDIGFVGEPMTGKAYLQNQDPAECGGDPTTDVDCYAHFAAANASRTPMIYVGTNDGFLHKIRAKNGVEKWGFVPDEVLPTLKTIALDSQHAYTVDGRMLAEDIFYRKGNTNEWKTMLFFGLRRGGNSFYALDITNAGANPKVKWKFSDATYSGESWAKPVVGQIRYQDGENLLQRWVAVFAGGYSPNAEVNGDSRGKAVFVVDASTGDLLWMAGYNNSDGADDEETTEYLELGTTDDIHYLTKSPLFNFAIPSALTAVDSTSDGILDTIYAGNLGGHLFRIDISGTDRADWKVYPVYEHTITDLASAAIDSIGSGGKIDVGGSAAGFSAGWPVRGLTSGATGFITEVEDTPDTITVTTERGTFQAGETIKSRNYAPIYLQPAVAFDKCYQLWVTFGTGDRDRPRTNPGGGKYIAIQGKTTNGVKIGDLQVLSLSGTDDTELAETTLDLVANKGWVLNFPGVKDKLFDPEPLILPDTYGTPHIYFNTYTPPGEQTAQQQQQQISNPCAAPAEGDMMLYDIALYCGPDTVEGGREEGRIAGGGIYQGKEFVQYLGTGAVGSVPPLDRVEDKRLPYPGGVIFIKERKR